MKIKHIVIEGHEEDITVRATDDGAAASVVRMSRAEGRFDKVIAEFRRDESREARYAKACIVAARVYGNDRQGRPAATNSMIHEVLNEIERIAGC
jgi:hypothetical protein